MEGNCDVVGVIGVCGLGCYLFIIEWEFKFDFFIWFFNFSCGFDVGWFKIFGDGVVKVEVCKFCFVDFEVDWLLWFVS